MTWRGIVAVRMIKVTGQFSTRTYFCSEELLLQPKFGSSIRGPIQGRELEESIYQPYSPMGMNPRGP